MSSGHLINSASFGSMERKWQCWLGRALSKVVSSKGSLVGRGPSAEWAGSGRGGFFSAGLCSWKQQLWGSTIAGTVHLKSCPRVLKYNPYPFLQAVSQEHKLREVWIWSIQCFCFSVWIFPVSWEDGAPGPWSKLSRHDPNSNESH